MARLYLGKDEEAFRVMVGRAATSSEPDPYLRWRQIVETDPGTAASALIYATKKILESP